MVKLPDGFPLWTPGPDKRMNPGQVKLIGTRFFAVTHLAIGLLSLSLVACQQQSHEQPLPAANHPRDEVILSLDSPKRDFIKETTIELVQRPLMDAVTGKITYDETRTARVSSPIAGRVTGGIAALGAYVRTGDTLAELNSPELGQAQSAYAGAMSDLNLANRTFQRIQELYDNGIAPRKEREQAEDSLIRARSEAERARLKLVNLGVRSQRPDNRFVLHAPLSGTITERNINPGMEVRSDLTVPLFVISDLDQLWVQMDIFEKDIGLIHAGATVLLQVPAYRGEDFTATVGYISQVVNETTRTVKVRCILPNAERRLLPAMFASITVQSDADDLAVVVPLNAIFADKESDWAYVNIGDYHYQKRPVTVGLRLKDRAVILDGLKPGDRLVVGGALLLRTEQDTEQQSGESAP
ncbi:efflux RND transporter periplasmic adaptor subunit [Nitrosospira sp. Nsp13]|uniref:efflux RND transporter periplasmic adaptor subunit n=1 Tax=Nitrosospira sp. Nsp13 TaxID=1855332 RepID=UPI000882DC70|nr:efflux RND transporter periplasmic adaptor subunit [Nitrosospira sp. Nsp13]SCX88463.1 membrane fusion protein, cobalt-zinc-cadmium efflux system [Nitrosospira sp. Nsp13]